MLAEAMNCTCNASNNVAYGSRNKRGSVTTHSVNGGVLYVRQVRIGRTFSDYVYVALRYTDCLITDITRGYQNIMTATNTQK